MAISIAQIETRAAFIEAWNAGARPPMLLFWGHTGSDAKAGPYVFSQWREAPFVVDGVTYRTAEHYMMAEKARVFGDDDSRAKILAAASPGVAKALGRAVANYDDDVWLKQRFEIVVAASLAKFGQTTMLRDYLLSTKGKVLVEASPQDRVWGVGLARDDARIQDPNTWQGDNLLGFALMAARRRLATS